jgi:hypothetical protein|tara:strand:+ start:5391 stop:5669 length:279 start_codon:yes stop_codon:yes gene_type:complete
MTTTKELVMELLTPPPVGDPESQLWWWSDKGYKVGSLTGEQQAAAIYLDHIKSAPISRGRGWIISLALVRAMKYSPDLIVMAARMKKLMLED